MPDTSKRGQIMPASPIRKLVPLANKAKERGVKVYHLNIGQPDLPTPQVGLDALKHIDRTVLEYSPSEGLRSLREKLADYYHRFNIDVDVDDIIVTTGGSEAVLFAFMACLDPGDEIIVPEPAYANYMAFAISAGAKIVTVPSSIDEGFALPPLEKFEALITPRTKGILICNPNNPTGYLYTMKEMLQIRDLVKKYDLFLFSDEVYREFCYTGAPYISAFHLPDIEENVVLIDSVSKRYNECGIRIGAIITKHKELKKNVMKFCQASARPDRGRGVDRRRSGLYAHDLQRICGAAQIPYRRPQPHTRLLFADTNGRILHRGQPAGRRRRPFLRMVPERLRL